MNELLKKRKDLKVRIRTILAANNFQYTPDSLRLSEVLARLEYLIRIEKGAAQCSYE